MLEDKLAAFLNGTFTFPVREGKYKFEVSDELRAKISLIEKPR